MPFVKISVLPIDDCKPSDVMEAMEKDFADNAGLDVGTATFLWQTLDCITHRKLETDPPRSIEKFDPSEEQIPIFVDLYITSVFNYDGIAAIMNSITNVLNEQTGIGKDNVFIHTHIAEPGQVFISGKVWPCVLTHPGAGAPEVICSRGLVAPGV